MSAAIEHRPPPALKATRAALETAGWRVGHRDSRGMSMLGGRRDSTTLYAWRGDVRLYCDWTRPSDGGRWAFRIASVSLRYPSQTPEDWARVDPKTFANRSPYVHLGAARDVATIAAWDEARIVEWVHSRQPKAKR